MILVRMLLILSIVLLPACSAEPTQLVTDDPVAVVSVAPKVDTLRPGSSRQFVASAMSRLGEDQSILATWSSTGGTVSQTGHFEAGDSEGTFLVIATCLCGLADTARVTIEAEPAAEAELQVQVDGLPDGISPTISISGPLGLNRSVTASTRLTALPSGLYAIVAENIANNGVTWVPTPASISLELLAPVSDTVVIAYRQVGANGLALHPRVWMTPERVDHLKAQAQANTVRWTRVYSASLSQLSRGIAYSSADLKHVPGLCLSYLATGDVRFATRAGAILSGYAVEENDLVGDSGYGIRFLLPVVTMGLDWCYDGLTVGVRRQAATWLMNRADWVWPASNPARQGAHGTGGATTNYFWGFIMTGPAALAAFEDDTGSGVISGTNRPSYHKALAEDRWLRLGKPLLENEGIGGTWAEGTNYESTWRLGSLIDAFATAGSPLAESFLQESLRWRLHSTMPDGKHKVPFGDQPRVSTAPLYRYDRMAALYALDANPSGAATYGAEIYRWLEWIGQTAPSENGTTATLADELLRFRPSHPIAPTLNALPKSHFAPGTGFFVYRTSWTDANTTVMAFQSGPNRSHGGLSQNNLMIWKGNFWISADANIYSHSGVQGATEKHNSMTVGSYGQALYGGNGGEIVGTPQLSDALVTIRGQARNAYGYPGNVSYGRTVVDDYLRTVAFLPQEDVFVIVDRVTAFNPALTKTWRWHMKNAPSVNGQGFMLEGPARDFRCFGSVVAPADVVLGTQAFNLSSSGTTGAVTSHAVTVSTVGRASDVVVTVLQCTGASSAPASASAEITSTEAIVTVAGKRVIVPLAETQPVRVE